MARRGASGAAGFTLLEIVVALAILSAALFVLLDAYYNSLRLYDDAREQVTMRNLLSQAVGRAEVEVLAGNLGGSGKFGKRFEGYSYTFEASQVGDYVVPVYEVLVTVEGPAETQEVNTLVFNPRRR